MLAAKPNLRLVVDPALGGAAAPLGRAADPLGSFRTAGGAVLVTAPGHRSPTIPAGWAVHHPPRADRRRARATWTSPGASVRGVT